MKRQQKTQKSPRIVTMESQSTGNHHLIPIINEKRVQTIIGTIHYEMLHNVEAFKRKNVRSCKNYHSLFTGATF